MAVVRREQLEASPLADLHALASELGIEDYRRLRRPELIGAILGPGEEGEESSTDGGAEPSGRRATAPAADAAPQAPADEESRSGVLDILPNGSGFLRADPYLRSRDDAYVSAAQIRRCELRAGDELAGPVRPPRRSERHYSLIRIESVNGAPAEPPPERPLFEEMTPVHPTERLAAPDELTHVPFGRGSRVMVFGPPGAGATTLLRRIAATLSASNPDLPMTVVLAGAKPEEIPEWRAESQAEVVGGSFDESQRGQAEIAVMAIERAKRAAERGQDAVVVLDSLSGLPSEVARRILGAARKLEGAGSVTVIAAVGETPDLERLATTRIVLERGARPGAPPRLHEAESGTLRAELLS